MALLPASSESETVMKPTGSDCATLCIVKGCLVGRREDGSEHQDQHHHDHTRNRHLAQQIIGDHAHAPVILFLGHAFACTVLELAFGGVGAHHAAQPDQDMCKTISRESSTGNR